MDLRDRTLVRKLAVVLVIKLAVLTGLWWGYVREDRLEPDASQVASAVLRAAPAADSYAPEGAP